MQSIILRSHVGSDGVVQLQLPDELRDQDVTITVSKGQQNLWQPGFFEEVIGCWEGEPLTRAEQGKFESRIELN